MNWAAYRRSSFVRQAVFLVRSAKVTRYVRLLICPSPGESRSSERPSGGNPATRSSSLPAASLPTGRRPLCQAGRPSRDLGFLVVPPWELWLCFRPSAPAISDLSSCDSNPCFDSKLALFGAFVASSRRQGGTARRHRPVPVGLPRAHLRGTRFRSCRSSNPQ